MKLTKKNPTEEVPLPKDESVSFKKIVSFNFQTGERKTIIETTDKTLQKNLKEKGFT